MLNGRPMAKRLTVTGPAKEPTKSGTCRSTAARLTSCSSLNLNVLARLPGRATARHFMLHQARSEEHTSELQSHSDLVCRLLLEKKKKKTQKKHSTTISTVCAYSRSE